MVEGAWAWEEVEQAVLGLAHHLFVVVGLMVVPLQSPLVVPVWQSRIEGREPWQDPVDLVVVGVVDIHYHHELSFISRIVELHLQ